MRRSVLATLALVTLAACTDQPFVPPGGPTLARDAAQGQADIIPGQYIVVFHDDVPNPVAVARQVAASHGLTLRHTYQHTIKGFSAVVPEGAVAALQRLPFVQYIEPNRYSYIDTHERLRTPAARVQPASFTTGFAGLRLAAAAFPMGALSAPSNLTATTVNTTQIDLAWQDNSNGETGSRIERRLGQTGSFAEVGQVGSDVTTFRDSGLTPDTEYCYRVRDYKQKGKKTEFSGYSNIACARTNPDAPPPPPPPPPDPPAGPSGLTATTASSSQINLLWTDNATNEDGFRIERCQNAGCTNFAQIAETAANTTSYNDMGLAASTTYRYRVRAFNAGGNSDYSNIAEATTDAAPPPPPPGECPDNGVHDGLSDPGLWGIVKVKADQNAKWKGVRGNGADCQMKAEFFGIDTGVDSDHPDLNVVETVCFLVGCTSGEDDHGHGTHTAGTAAAIDGGPAGGVVGVAPGAKIHGFKVCNSGGSCPNDAIIAGIDEVTARKNASPGTAMVANMSLGGGASDALDTAVRRSVNAGVIYTISAGNGVFGACFFPADAQTVSPARVGDDAINAVNGSDGNTKRANGAITTTSSNTSDNDANCNFGHPVTIASPGVGVKSTWLNGGYNTISGTSMAAPHTAGAAIIYLQDNLSATPTQAEQALIDVADLWTTNDLPNACRPDGQPVSGQCFGRLNVQPL